MKRKTILGRNAQEQLLSGIKVVHDAVATTIGAFGRNVLMVNDNGNLQLTKDGVTVAKQIRNLENPVENYGASFVKVGANQVVESAGDGTSTYTVLVYNIIKSAFDEIKDETTNVVQVKEGIEKACALVVQELKKLSIEIEESTFEKIIKDVAMISSNGDSHLSEVIKTSLMTAGKDGLVTCLKSKYRDVRMDVTTGFKIEQGFASEAFTNQQNLTCTLTKPVLFITDKLISSSDAILPLLQYCLTNQRDLFITAKEIAGEAIAGLMSVKDRGVINICYVENPVMIDKERSILDDMAIITGGKLLRADSGLDLAKNFNESWLGVAEKINITRNSTTIIGANSEKSLVDIDNRIALIKQRIELAESSNEKASLQNRLSRLTGGIITVLVGGQNAVEASERLDRAEDALLACKSALDEGVLVGGGCSLMKVSQLIDFEDNSIFINKHQKLGAEILKNAISKPFYTILRNSGLSEYEIFSKSHEIVNGLPNSVYNLYTNKIEDGLEKGIIDSFKVARVSLQQAVSVACGIITTNCVIYDEKEEGDDARIMQMMKQYEN